MPLTLPRSAKFLTTALLTASFVALATPPAWAQVGTSATPPAAAASHQYVLRFGDSLNMSLLENDKINIEDQAIRPDGRINFPLIGEVQAAGLTVAEFQARVTKAYEKYFIDPHVVLNVSHFRMLTIAVVGLVNKPDTFAVAEPMRLLQVLGLAGGVEHLRGDIHHVLVTHANGDHQMIDVEEVMEGKVDDNIMLYDGDTVRVFEVNGPDWNLILPTIANSLSILTSIIVILVNVKR